MGWSQRKFSMSLNSRRLFQFEALVRWRSSWRVHLLTQFSNLNFLISVKSVLGFSPPFTFNQFFIFSPSNFFSLLRYTQDFFQVRWPLYSFSCNCACYIANYRLIKWNFLLNPQYKEAFLDDHGRAQSSVLKDLRLWENAVIYCLIFRPADGGLCFFFSPIRKLNI